jgi:hypothetical protein
VISLCRNSGLQPAEEQLFKATFPPLSMTNNKVWYECPVLLGSRNTFRAQDEATLYTPPTIKGFPLLVQIRGNIECKY